MKPTLGRRAFLFTLALVMLLSMMTFAGPIGLFKDNVAEAALTSVPKYEQKLIDWKISPSVPGTTCGLPGGADADISKPGYDTAAWIDAIVPGTVLGNLIDAGIYDSLFMSLTGTTDE